MSFFPQLLSGPIARARHFLPQIEICKDFQYENIIAGARLILFGLFKKIVIANNLAPYTDAVFNNVTMHEGITFVVAGVFYAIQIYMDFSGYTDIAIGSARLLGFRLLENFKAPYLAASVTEFWRRWHISLSSWVRDYVHMPIQFRLRSLGNRAVILAIFATFLIIGIWHGAQWSFVMFGILMALAVSFEMVTSDARQKIFKRMPHGATNFIAASFVFCLVVSSMILLRGNSLQEIIHVYSNLGFTNARNLYIGSWPSIISALLGLIVILIPELKLNKQSFSEIISNIRIGYRWSYYTLLIMLIVAIGEFSNDAFIYYQF